MSCDHFKVGMKSIALVKEDLKAPPIELHVKKSLKS